MSETRSHDEYHQAISLYLPRSIIGWLKIEAKKDGRSVSKMLVMKLDAIYPQKMREMVIEGVLKSDDTAIRNLKSKLDCQPS